MTADRGNGPRADGGGARWTESHAAGVARTPETVAPVVEPPESDPAEGVHVWDTWLLRTRTGEVADLDGWRVAFSLTAPADLLPGTRHDVAEIRYFYSRDGREWHDGGPVFGDGALGQRQWAGSALYDDGDLYVFYTAAGEGDAEELTYTQRLAVGHGASIAASDAGVSIDGPHAHELLLEPDGELYETQAESEGMIYTFRDPWFYEDPGTGRTHLLFEANTPLSAADRESIPPARQPFNGSVGVAVSESGDPLEWELRPPLLTAPGVNQELERPHVVRADGRYYLFVSSHMHTFAPGLEGFDALYGFVADALDGDYRPLNGSGLVVTNPATAPFQAYSWMAFPHDEEVLVQSFFNYFEFDGDSLDEVAALSEAEQRRRFGGTLAPTLRLGVDGAETRVLGALDHWRVPLPGERLPEADPPAWTGRERDLDDAPVAAAAAGEPAVDGGRLPHYSLDRTGGYAGTTAQVAPPTADDAGDGADGD